jgi:formylglycine-generating enzyme required for sulfatase activity
VRTVHLTYPFWMSRCLITQAQFREVMARNPSYFEGDDLPVESVTWQEALEFCRRLTEIERVAKRISPSLHFRLPTEAEWEYACRAGLRPAAEGQEEPAELRAFWRGDPEALKAYAWFDLDSEETPHPVGTLKPNPWGLYDLLGNVAEWCMDWYGPYPEGEVTDPKGPEAGRRKVRRGGGWASVARRCRAADRIGVAPATASGLIGFRVVAVRIGEPPFSYNYHVW